MAVYQKLLLSAGGGIVSIKQQADQAKNTATVIIGLGGTGVDCLRTIKTQVRTRLKPDDPDAVVPEYSHIRFLGVDTDESSRGDATDKNGRRADALEPLDAGEFFSIANDQLKAALARKTALEGKKELRWLRWEDIPKPDLGKAGAGGIRQVGRFMLMDRASEFLSKVEQEINAAKAGLIDPTVNVHILTGLSGGTGAGCFLDVCYMVRSIADRMGGVTVFGYFFLPDVNLSRIPMSDVATRDYVPANGYASMQELDYCMQLQYNGGAFVQEYKGHKRIEWSQPPVDIAHLICATDSHNNVFGYDYAMGVTTEYVMDLLTQPIDENKFGTTSRLSNFQQMVRQADAKKDIGANLSYCAIGAACASLPLRQINTYLASELFEKFSGICQNEPTKTDVEWLVSRVLAKGTGAAEAYGSLMREIQDGSREFTAYPDDWKVVRDNGNHELVRHYTDQKGTKIGRVESNAKSMTSEGNSASLIGRTRTTLAEVIRDIERGPMFAAGMLSAARDHNLLNQIDGIIQENRSRWEQEAVQSDLRHSDYERAKSEFEAECQKALFANPKKKFEAYEYYLKLAIQHEYMMEVYEKFDATMQEYRKQVVSAYAAYYAKLARVTDTLVQTFNENREALKSEDLMQDESAFVQPLMSIEELKGPMDAIIREINVPGMLDAFMTLLIDNPDEWLQEDENKISRLVTKFFVDTAFGDFSGRTITSFLRDKYQTTTDEELTDHVFRDWIRTLTGKARPLFSFDGSVWDGSRGSESAYISVPDGSTPVIAAAERMHREADKWDVKASKLTDRIYIMGSSVALPISSYSKNAEYETLAFGSRTAGRHYYETPNLDGMSFSEWDKLPPLTPQSCIDAGSLPPLAEEIVGEGRSLFDRAYDAGIITEDNQYYKLDDEFAATTTALVEEARALTASIADPSQLPQANAMLERLKGVGAPKLVDAGIHTRHDGHRGEVGDGRKLAEDYFVSSPGLSVPVLQTLEALDAARSGVQSATAELEAKIAQVGMGAQDLDDFLNALFVGVIVVDGLQVKYVQNDFGVATEYVLSKHGPEFPHAAIPPYQAYLNFQTLADEQKAAIRQETDNRLNSAGQELIEVGTQLKTVLSDERANAWGQLAQTKAERDDIIDFIKKLKQQFNGHLLTFGI